MLNKIIQFSLHNRILIVVAAALLLVGGTYTAMHTEVDVFPDLNAPTVVIMTEAGGMAAEEVEQLVTFPVETAVNGTTNVRRVRSSSTNGFSVVWVEFDWGTDIYTARQIVSEKLATVADQLPDQVGQPTLGPQSSILGEMLIIGLTADSTSMLDLRTLADWTLRPRLLSTGGVAQVAVMGGDIQEYQIVVSPDRLRHYGISLVQVMEATEGMNVNANGGTLYEYGNEYIVRGMLATTDIDLLGRAVVGLSAGTPIRLADVADVRIGAKLPKLGLASEKGKPAVLLTVTKQPNTSTLDLTAQLEEALADVSKNLPPDVHISTDIFRQSRFIESSIGNVQEALLEGGIFVVVVLFLFLANVRTTFISLITLPLAVIVSIVALHLMGLTLNTMSLGGLAIAIGSLVDDAIVDVENVYQRLRQNRQLPQEQRRPVLEVVFHASAEVRMPILNSTLIIVASFVPLFFLTGMEGRMLIPLGIAFIVALCASTVVALTLTPVLCSYLLDGDGQPRCKWGRTLMRKVGLLSGTNLRESSSCLSRSGADLGGSNSVLGEGKPQKEEGCPEEELEKRKGRSEEKVSQEERVLDTRRSADAQRNADARLTTETQTDAAEQHSADSGDSRIARLIKRGYAQALDFVLEHDRAVLLGTICLFVAALAVFFTLGRSFLPPFNEGSFTINVSSLPGISLEESDKLGRRAEELLLQIPEIETVARKTGRAELDEHALGVNASELEAPFTLQGRSRSALTAEVREKLSVLSGANIEIGQPISHRIDAMLSGTQANIAIKLFGDDLGRLFRLAGEIKQAVQGIEGVADLNVEQQVERPQLTITPRREMLARYGISLPRFGQAVRVCLAGEVVSQVYDDGKSFDLTVRVADDLRDQIDKLGDLLIDTELGEPVPLSYVADIRSTSGPNTINRENVKRKVVISANVDGRDLRSVVSDMRQAIDTQVSLPEGYHVEYGGQFESEQAASRTLALTCSLAIVVIFLLIYHEFHDLQESAIILINLPLALIGGVFALLVTSGEVSIPATIGFISLFGIATRGGMLLISRYRRLQEVEGLGLRESVVRGSLDRLNPILMTALSSALALIPLAVGGDLSGNEIQNPMAKVILGGLLTSTLLNGFIIPIVYLMLHKHRQHKNSGPRPAMLAVSLALFLLPLTPARGQNATDSTDGIAQILQIIEANNKDLQANARLIASQKLENRASNNLPDPTLEYAHVWDRDDSDITEGELIVSQSFDFPTLYATRSRLNRHRANALDAQAMAYRQTTLLQAKELCLDIIYLQQQQALLDQRLRDAQELDALYRQRLQSGDANILETNKIRLELLNVRTETRMNQTALAGKLKELSAMAGNQPLGPGRGLSGYSMAYAVDEVPLAATGGQGAGNSTARAGGQSSSAIADGQQSTATSAGVQPAIPGLVDYPADPLPSDFGALCARLLAADPSLQAMESERQAAQRQRSVSRQGWLPQLEVGYRRNTESGHPLNGVVVGLSIPIFQNRGRARQARNLELSTGLQLDQAQLQASAELWQLYEEAGSLHQAMQEYEETLAGQQDLDLLRQALNGGEISLVTYFLEAATVYQSRSNLLSLQHQYHVAMARLYKSML